MAIQCGQCKASKANLELTTRILESGVNLQIVRCMLCGWDKSKIKVQHAMPRHVDLTPHHNSGSGPHVPVKIICAKCGDLKLHSARDLCKPCYSYEILRPGIDQRYPRNPENRKSGDRKPDKPCVHCQKTRQLNRRQLCRSCYTYQGHKKNLDSYPLKQQQESQS